MIQTKVINAIYKKYKNRPASPDELDIPLLFEKLPDEAGVSIEDDRIVFNSVNPSSPFHSIPVNHIHAIVEFDEAVAIVLHSSILFISKEDGSANIHIKNVKPGLLDSLRGFISRQAMLF